MKVIVIGSHGHAGVVLDAIWRRGLCEIVGLLDDFVPADTLAHGWRTLGGIEKAKDYPDCLLFVAVGDNAARESIVKRIGGTFALSLSVIHPSSYVGLWSTVGRGSFVAADAVVGANSQVGEFSIINTHASLDHDSKVGNFSHLAPGVVTGGHVKIGDRTFIGVGSTIRDRVTIGNNCLIGMGSNVLDDIPDNSTAYGNPCKLQVTR